MPGQNGHGGARRHAGRPAGSIRNASDRKELALAASEYTGEALDTLVRLMRSSKQDTVKMMAADARYRRKRANRVFRKMGLGAG
jgi:hypothetical protein